MTRYIGTYGLLRRIHMPTCGIVYSNVLVKQHLNTAATSNMARAGANGTKLQDQNTIHQISPTIAAPQESKRSKTPS